MKRLSFLSTTYHFPFKNHSTLPSFSLPRKQSTLSPSLTTAAAAAATDGGATNTTTTCRRQKKMVVIMGPTGSGKSKLSIDLATRFFPSSEIINSDKIQVYKGLNITTNKIPLHERKNVPHHLLGLFDPSESHPEFTPSDFRSLGSSTISKILSSNKIPFLVGGSNSFIYALVAQRFDPKINVFDGPGSGDDSAFCKELRYKCCFVWVDVSLPLLNQYLVKRVDEMLDSGMFEELTEYFMIPSPDSVSRSGLRKAIGVPEFERYFERLKENKKAEVAEDADVEEYEEAVRAIKENTCQLAKRQLGKILRLRDAAGWELNRVDATPAFTAAMGGDRAAVADIWERQVVEPSVKIVNRFLME